MFQHSPPNGVGGDDEAPPLTRPASALSVHGFGNGPVASWSGQVPRSDTLNIVSWNCNGLRSTSMKPNQPLAALFDAYQADVFCLQETKMSSWDDVEALHGMVPGFDAFFSFSRARKGWSGVATFVREGCTLSAKEDLGDLRTDGEGRVLCTDHGRFVLFNIYFPNAGRGPERLEYKLRFYDTIEEQVRGLRAQGRHVVVVGDVNTAHRDIDIWTDAHGDQTGCLPVERAWMDRMLRSDLTKDTAPVARETEKRDEALPPAAASSHSVAVASCAATAATAASIDDPSPALNSEAVTSSSAFTTLAVASATTPFAVPLPPLVDSYRYFYPHRRGAYTYWDMRAARRETNDGWRIDYMMVSCELMAASGADAEIHARQRGSDHCPTSLHLCLPPAAEVAEPATFATVSPSKGSSRLARIGRFLSADGRGPFPFPPPPSATCSVAARSRSKFQRQGSLQSFFKPAVASASSPSTVSALSAPSASAASPVPKRKAGELDGPAAAPVSTAATPRPANALAALRVASPRQPTKKAKKVPAAGGASSASNGRGPSIVDMFQRKPS